MNKIDTFDKFIETYLINSLEDVLFKTARDILNNKKTSLKNKQRRLEKLFNVFLMKKNENSFNLNPLWTNKLNNVFLDEKRQFINNYSNFIIKNMSSYNKIIDICSIISPSEVFDLLIYVLLKNETEYKTNNKDLGMLKKLEFLNLTSEVLFSFYYESLLIEGLKLYLVGDCKLISSLNYELFYSELLSLYNNQPQKIFLKTILLFFLNKKENELKNTQLKHFDGRSSEYKKLKTDYLSYFNKKLKKLIFVAINHYVSHAINVFFELKVLEKFSSTSYTSKGYKKIDYISLFNVSAYSKLFEVIYVMEQLPMVFLPNNWDLKGETGGYLLNKNAKNSTSLCKKLKRGISSIKYSKVAVNAINTIQHKTYMIETDYLMFIKSPLFREYKGLLTKEQLYNYYNLTYDEYVSISKKITSLKNSPKFNECEKQIINLKSRLKKEKKTSSEIYNSILELKAKYGFSEDDNLLKLKIKLKKLESEFLSEVMKHNEYEFIMRSANLLIGYKLYLVSRYDFRMRFFPLGRGLHRAAGIYKYLLADFEKFVYNDTSLKILKQFISFSYLGSSYETISNQFLLTFFEKSIYNVFLKDKELCSFVIELFKGYHNHYRTVNDLLKNYLPNNKNFSSFINFITKASDRINFLRGLFEYIKLEKEGVLNYKSNFTIDIDQSSSGPMIYSLLSGDKEMGYKTNVFPSNDGFRNDLYLHFLNLFKNELKKSNRPEFDFFKKHSDSLFDRSFSKLLIMPIFYNMQERGIINLLIDSLKAIGKFNDFVLWSGNKFSNILKSFATFIMKLVQDTYPDTIKYQTHLAKFAKILQEENQAIVIRTIDGSLIKYRYVESEMIYKRLKTPSNKFLTYRLYISPYYMDEGEEERKLQISKQQYISFPPNFIHSLDGALCRLICIIYYSLLGSIPEPLHDSFRVHPSNVQNLINVIKYVYLFYFFNEYVIENKLSLTVYDQERILITYNNKEIYNLYANFGQPTKTANQLKQLDFIYDLFLINALSQNSVDVQEQLLSVYQNLLSDSCKFSKTQAELLLKSDFMFSF